MNVLPIPNRCIWCLESGKEVIFNKSHVVPECVGNEIQVLPPGIVCKECNQYFGTKLEPILLDDPLFHIIAVYLSLVDPDDMNYFRNKIFDKNHPSTERINRDLNLQVQIKGQKVEANISYQIQGVIERIYSRRNLQGLSRAIYKIAFEALAYNVFVKGVDKSIDVFSDEFHPIRRWTRRGQPRHIVRPVLRRPTNKISTKWEERFWQLKNNIAVELNLFGDWYAVSLTSDPNKALDDLISLVGKNAENVWCIDHALSSISNKIS